MFDEATLHIRTFACISYQRGFIFLFFVLLRFVQIFAWVTMNLITSKSSVWLWEKERIVTEVQSFSAAFFVSSSCWLFRNLSCKKKIVSYYSIWSCNLSRMHAGSDESGGLETSRPTNGRSDGHVLYISVCAYASRIGYRVDIIFDGRLVDHYVTDERHTSCCVLVRLLSTCFHACQLLRRIADRRVEDHVPICI